MLNLRIDKDQLWYFTGFALITILSVSAGFALRQYLLMLAPVIILFGYIALIDFKKIFYLLLFLLPLSTEVEIGSFGTDLPTEPLMVALMFIFIIFAAAKPNFISWKFVKHPIVLTLLVHWLWMAFVIMYSENKVVSFKWLLAKSWYIITFVFVAGIILNSTNRLKRFFWLLFISLSAMVAQSLVRYAMMGFNFEFVNEPLYPFFRNHVNYAAMITIFYPFIFLAVTWYEPGTWKRRILQWAKVFFLVGIYFSYTRACFLALILAGLAYIVINYRLLTWGFRIAIVLLLAGVGYLSIQNNYLKLAPEYTKTIYHKEFGDHLAATVELQDVSSMERVYRWVAAFHMIKDRPLTGVGTGNFYPYYQRYTVTDFITYTSDNEERSTVHNYFLLTITEQGLPGLLLFLTFTLAIFYYGEKGYLKETDPERRRVILTVVLALVIVYVNLMLSDLVEVDKTGSLFFMCVAILVNVLVGNWNRNQDSLDSQKDLQEIK